MIGGCHCFCALFKHLGACDGHAVTTRELNGVDIPMCAPCVERFDQRILGIEPEAE